MEAVPFIGIKRHCLATDGNGVTTLAALHGCPLRCKYCLNPQCLHPEGVWKRYTPAQLYEEVKRDELYFLATGGGITFGGGEPCLQSDFIGEFREWCGPEWRIAVETSLNVPRRHLERLLPVVNHYYADIKDTDPGRYLHYTGSGNEQVIQNLKWLTEQGKASHITVRVPLIPSFNTEKDVEDSIRQLKKTGISRFDRLIYRT